jgi:hypothetical protein
VDQILLPKLTDIEALRQIAVSRIKFENPAIRNSSCHQREVTFPKTYSAIRPKVTKFEKIKNTCFVQDEQREESFQSNRSHRDFSNLRLKNYPNRPKNELKYANQFLWGNLAARTALVHVDGSQAGRQRLQFAIDLALRTDARLGGLHVMPPPDVPPLYKPSQLDESVANICWIHLCCGSLSAIDASNISTVSTRHDSACSRREIPEFACLRPSPRKRAQGRPGAVWHPRPLCGRPAHECTGE